VEDFRLVNHLISENLCDEGDEPIGALG